jgi:hypothetical protein
MNKPKDHFDDGGDEATPDEFRSVGHLGIMAIGFLILLLVIVILTI